MALARPSQAGQSGPKLQALEQQFADLLAESTTNSVLGLQLLKQLCSASRARIDGQLLLPDKRLIVIIENAHMLAPQGEIARLSEPDRRRIEILKDWLQDPDFAAATDTVVVIAETREQLNDEITRLPQLAECSIPLPDAPQRSHLIACFCRRQGQSKPPLPQPSFWCAPEELSALTAGLSIQALTQMLKGCAHSGKPLQPKDVSFRVEAYVKSQMGGEAVEFARPSGTPDDCVGNRSLKAFVTEEFMPRLAGAGLVVFIDEADTAFGGVGRDIHETERRLTGGFQNMMSDEKISLGGAIVCGSNGAGKTFLFKKVAAAMKVPMLTIKNMRSMWYGQTDVIMNRLGRCLAAFGGRVFWLLLTARPHLLSSDIRRAGRCGNFIMPVIDPQGQDLDDFINWAVKPSECPVDDGVLGQVRTLVAGRSAADFDLLRDDLSFRKRRANGPLGPKDIIDVINSRIPGDIAVQRRIQTLHALLECTHPRLLPIAPAASAEETKNIIDQTRESWRKELQLLEAIIG